ncbi:hypothetical protein DPX16_23245 [Anabarilius grahami]|uniref:Uncharacterized protein n=1 Tax=Anabarilius grahami TaxID=495550 RepID=A0A3N0Z3T5_ANAGA|nr:hypothetical protein DPX16_23245 [Anabarilius grahami]
MEHLAQTAPRVYQGFLDGDFVAKEAKHRFNKVPFFKGDLCLEHINKTGKVAGGLVGITQNETAKNCWSITYNESVSLAQDTRSLFGLTHDGEDDEDNHKDCLPSRLRRDNDDVIQLVDQFQRYHVFQLENMYELVSLTTGDVASEDILNDLTHAAESGKLMVTELVKKRMSTMNTNFHNSLTKRKLKTFSNLYRTDSELGELISKCVKPDRDIFRSIIVSMEWQRESVLRPTSKADLATKLQAGAKETVLSPSLVHSLGLMFPTYGLHTKKQIPACCYMLLMPQPKEQFVCKLYDPKTTSTSIHDVRCALFRKVKANVDTLPPTKDALYLHLMRGSTIKQRFGNSH